MHRPRVDDDGPQVKNGAPLSGGQNAATGEIARDAGGDGVIFEDEYVLAEMLLHLRHTYTLRFDGAADKLNVDLVSAARARFPNAVVRFRVLYQAGGGMEEILMPPPDDGKKTQKRKAVNESPN